jgi:hypothetical protein
MVGKSGEITFDKELLDVIIKQVGGRYRECHIKKIEWVPHIFKSDSKRIL